MSEEMLEGNNEGLNLDDDIQDDDVENNEDTENAENDSDDKDLENNDKKEDDGDIYGSPETFDYSEVSLPENMKLDEEMLDKFNPIAKELNLSNKSANRLMNLAVELTQKNSSKIAEQFATQYQEVEKKSYLQLLNTDEELNSYSDEEYDQYLSTANLGIKSIATQGFKDIIKAKGLTNHPEFIKTFHAIGKLCKNDKLPDVKNPVGREQSAADILYGSKE